MQNNQQKKNPKISIENKTIYIYIYLHIWKIKRNLKEINKSNIKLNKQNKKSQISQKMQKSWKTNLKILYSFQFWRRKQTFGKTNCSHFCSEVTEKMFFGWVTDQ